MRVFVIGYPADVGGANTELWHTVKLWRRQGLEVTLIPAWHADAKWRARLDYIGCETLQVHRRAFSLPRGCVCAGFCHSVFVHQSARLQAEGCRLVYVPCMSGWADYEVRRHEEAGPFQAYVFQSRAQKQALWPLLRQHNVPASRCHLIRGAFDADEFPFRPLPHLPGEPFVIGRLSRPDPAKFAAKTWALYSWIRELVPGLRVRIMGWSRTVEQKLGPPPPWAECLPPRTESAVDFLGSLHCLVQANDRDPGNPKAVENWPRVGLEAMAAGVPVVADRRGGWCEMIRRRETGWLATTHEEMADYVAGAAHSEDLRLGVANRARAVLTADLANPKKIWPKWQALFEQLD